MELIGIRSSTLTTGNVKRSSLRRLKNDVPQGFLARLVFNIYISDLPTTVSRKYAYANDLAIMFVDGDWQAVEEMLSKDMANVSEYLHTWKLKLSITKAVLAAELFPESLQEGALRLCKGNWHCKINKNSTDL